MEWINPRFTQPESESGIDPSIVRGLEALNLPTLEDFLGIWSVESLRPSIAHALGTSMENTSAIVANLLSGALQNSDPTLRISVADSQLERCLFGLLEPDQEPTGNLSEEMVNRSGIPVFLINVRASKANLIKHLKVIQDQARRGTCVAFGTLPLLEYLYGHLSPKFSEQFLYWGSKRRDGSPNSPGTYISSAIECLLEEGVCDEDDWPYNPDPGETEHQGPPPANALKNAVKYKIARGVPVGGTDVNAMRDILAGTSGLSARPISFGIPVFDSWLKNPLTYQTGKIPMPLPEEQHRGGHCMTLVGFQDDDSWPGGGYFIFRNSWSEAWAAECDYGSGYGTVPYAYIAKYGWDAWTIEIQDGTISRAIKAALNSVFKTGKALIAAGALLGIVGATFLAWDQFVPDLSMQFGNRQGKPLVLSQQDNADDNGFLRPQPLHAPDDTLPAPVSRESLCSSTEMTKVETSSHDIRTEPLIAFTESFRAEGFRQSLAAISNDVVFSVMRDQRFEFGDRFWVTMSYPANADRDSLLNMLREEGGFEPIQEMNKRFSDWMDSQEALTRAVCDT